MRIAIGTGQNKNILKAVEIFKNKYTIETIMLENDKDLSKAILNPDIDAVVR